MKIKVINCSNNPLPSYQTEGSSGLDVCAFLEENLILKPFQRALVPTGLYFEIPENMEIQVRPRSGLALKHGITLLNSPATIDADYRGELKIIMVNLGQEDFLIENGMRIAQLVFARVCKVQLELSETINVTGRNDKGFGHSGI